MIATQSPVKIEIQQIQTHEEKWDDNFMCGIAGVFSADASINDSDRVDIGKVGQLLNHRGPDDSNINSSQNFLAVHARLAIIDLDNGKQPMVDDDTDNVIVFNGEIYNYIEVRAQLVKAGVKFNTSSDTEVLLKGYAYYGNHILDHLVGMFAFVIYDKNANKIFAARDRFGEKPFYYYKIDNKLYFASELSALNGFSNCPNRISKSALLSYLANGYIIGPGSILEDVYQLEPGFSLTLDCHSNLTIQKYYSINWKSNLNSALSDEDIYESLKESIRLRLRSDVPVASFLSGGIDSTMVTSIAQSLSNNPLRTYTFGIKSQESEIPLARQTAQALGTEHREVLLDYEFDESAITKIIESLDMPLADSAIVPVYELSRIVAADGIKVVLSGEGGDELFGGYPWYQSTTSLKSRVKEILIGNKGRAADYILGKFIFEENLLSSTLGKKLYNDFFNGMQADLEKYTVSVNGKIAFDYKYFMAWDLLPKVDRMSMAHSLEVRVPFLDHNLVQQWASLAGDLKVNNNRFKYRIKEFALNKKLVSNHLLNQKKMGLNLPLNGWMRKNESLVRDILLSNNSLSVELMGKSRINEWFQEVLVSTQITGWTKCSQRLWTLLVLDLWYRKFSYKAYA